MAMGGVSNSHRVIEDKNRELIESARKPIERLHAGDMSSFVGDFKDWNGNERTEFTKRCLAQIFQPHQFGYLSCTLSLKDLQHFKHVQSSDEKIPSTRPGLPIGLALGFDEAGEGMDLRNLYFVIRDAVRFIHRKAGTIHPKLP
jgi:hypothetical protein